MKPRQTRRVLMHPLAHLLGPAVPEVGFEEGAVGFVEVEGDLAEWVVGFSGHDSKPM